MEQFFAGVVTMLVLDVIFWLAWYLAPLGDPETGIGRLERDSCDTDKPQPPPSIIVSEFFGETRQSKRARKRYNA